MTRAAPARAKATPIESVVVTGAKREVAFWDKRDATWAHPDRVEVRVRGEPTPRVFTDVKHLLVAGGSLLPPGRTAIFRRARLARVHGLDVLGAEVPRPAVVLKEPSKNAPRVTMREEKVSEIAREVVQIFSDQETVKIVQRALKVDPTGVLDASTRFMIAEINRGADRAQDGDAITERTLAVLKLSPVSAPSGAIETARLARAPSFFDRVRAAPKWAVVLVGAGAAFAVGGIVYGAVRR